MATRKKAAKAAAKRGAKQAAAPQRYVVEVRHGDGALHHMETFDTRAEATRYAKKGAALVGQPFASAQVFAVPPAAGGTARQRGGTLVHTHTQSAGAE